MHGLNTSRTLIIPHLIFTSFMFIIFFYRDFLPFYAPERTPLSAGQVELMVRKERCSMAEAQLEEITTELKAGGAVWHRKGGRVYIYNIKIIKILYNTYTYTQFLQCIYMYINNDVTQ